MPSKNTLKAPKMPRLVIAGLKGGSGKTILTVGLIRALKNKGLNISPFKKGPDYIDAGWLAQAAGKPCYNLDPFLIGQEAAISSFSGHFDGDCALIEGNRGVFDGMDAEGTMSTANLAKSLKAPVLLIVDCTKMTRTAAAIILGIKNFDPRLKLAGVVLNQLAGKRHEKIIRESIEKYAKVPVFGAIPRLSGLHLPERHMGLTPFQEHTGVEESIEDIADALSAHLDMEGILKAAKSAPALKTVIKCPKKAAFSVKIGIIKDPAFQFYYPENFEALEELGARLIEINSFTANGLPEIDALYIGGGFPETQAVGLSKNVRFRDSLKRAARQGLPIYAECGGLMYLGESIITDEKKYPMAGVFPVSFTLHKKPQAHGYTIVKVAGDNPFYKKGTVIRGHEFHYSRLTATGKTSPFVFKMLRGEGISGGMDGLLSGNVLASYTHIHALGTPEWAKGMIKAAKRHKAGKGN